MPYFPLFAGGKAAPFVPPVGSALIYTGTDPHPGDWSIDAGILLKDGDDVYATEPLNITNLQASFLSLDGEFFFTELPNLSNLTLNGNPLTTLDVSSLASLASLNVSGCSSLSSLNVAGCVTVTNIDCSFCNLATLDIAGCINLTILNANGNVLTDIFNLSDATDLFTLTIGSNQFTTFSIAGVVFLSDFQIWNNFNLTSIVTDVNNFGLNNFNAANDTNLMVLDTSGFSSIQALIVSNCGFLSADLDAFLANANATAVVGGFMDLQVINGTQPTGGAANADLVALQGNSWTVVINT